MSAEDWSALILESSGKIPLGQLLAGLVSLADLRRLATSQGLEPKGGFRVAKASAEQLGDLLADASLVRQDLRETVSELLAAPEETSGGPPVSRAAGTSPNSALEKRVKAAERRADRERKSAAQARASLAEAIGLRDEARGALVEVRARVQSLEVELSASRQDVAELERQISEDEGAGSETRVDEGDGDLRDREASARRRIAELTTELREAQALNDELESLLPRGGRERLRLKRRNREERSSSALLPVFTDGFLKSLEDLETEQLRRVWTAIAQLVLSGLDYPGLHAKSLKGMGGLSSIRAGAHLRVYFTRRADIVHLDHAGSREEQETFLKKRRDG